LLDLVTSSLASALKENEDLNKQLLVFKERGQTLDLYDGSHNNSILIVDNTDIKAKYLPIDTPDENVTGNFPGHRQATSDDSEPTLKVILYPSLHIDGEMGNTECRLHYYKW